METELSREAILIIDGVEHMNIEFVANTMTDRRGIIGAGRLWAPSETIHAAKAANSLVLDGTAIIVTGSGDLRSLSFKPA
jgi:hypothetical protein